MGAFIGSGQGVDKGEQISFACCMRAIRLSGEYSCIVANFSDRGGGEPSDHKGVGA